MQLTHLTILLSVILAPSISQKLTPDAVTSLLQGILSPANTEQVIQVLSAGANMKKVMANIPGADRRRFAITDNVPRGVRNKPQIGITQIVQRPREMGMKKNVIVQNGQQIVLPNNMVVQRRPEAVLSKNVVIQNGGEIKVPRNVIVRRNESPKRVIVQNNEFSLRGPQMGATEVVKQNVLVNQQMRPEVQQKVLISQPQVAEYMTGLQQKVFNHNEYPFLPAASPVSPLTALSSSCAVPPVIPQSRGQFLRKIPIPPPSL